MKTSIAVIGAGDWTLRHHLPALIDHPDAELAAIVDSDETRARTAAALFGAPRVFSDVDALIAANVADGAIVATPHDTHAQLGIPLLRAGIGALIEKPLATTAADAFDLVRVSEETGTLLCVGFTAQYSAAASAVRQWVRQDIGELIQVLIEFSSRAARLYEQADPHDARSAYSASTGSGQATTQLSHAIGAVAWATGREFETVAALTRSGTRATGVDVDDAAVLRLQGDVLVSAASTGRVSADLPMRHHVRFVGERGIVDHDLLGSVATLTSAEGVVRRVAPSHLEPPYPAAAPVRRFVDLLRGEGDNPAPARPAAAAAATIAALLESARTSSLVRVLPLPAPSERP